MSQEMQGKVHEPCTEKKKKVHTLKETAIDAGLQALQRLSEVPAPAVKMTARAAISKWLPSIITEQARGTSLLRIYNDLRKAAGLKISYRSFQNYVSKASQAAGLRPGKPKAEAEAAPSGMVETASEKQWNCAECETKAERRESKSQHGKFFWQCAACGTYYADNNGELSNIRMRK